MRDAVRIRALTEGDLPAVVAIEQATYSTPWPESSFRGLIGRRETALFVAERVPAIESDGGSAATPEIAGYAVCWSVLQEGELGNIAVAERWRHQGIARQLLEMVIDTMRERGVRELFLEVRPSNRVAQELYRKYGFKEVAQRRAYYSKPVEDAIVMRARLDRVE